MPFMARDRRGSSLTSSRRLPQAAVPRGLRWSLRQRVNIGRLGRKLR